MHQRTRSARTRAVTLALALATALAVAAAPAVASTGGVYFDVNQNAAAGNPGQLFNATFTGDHNVGLGPSVMPNLTTGQGNTALGYAALGADRAGGQNTATGAGALFSNTIGDNNVATGSGALQTNRIGSQNVAIGTAALPISTGSRNVAIGSIAGQKVTGNDNIDIANSGVSGESGTIRIGTAANQSAAFLAGVWNKTTGGTTKAVVINKNGRLGTAPAPAAPLKSQSKTLGRLRDKVHQQSIELRQQGAAIQRLRKQMQSGG